VIAVPATPPVGGARVAPPARPAWRVLAGCVSAEALKLRRRASTWILAVILFLYVVVLSYLVLFAVFKSAPASSLRGSGLRSEDLMAMLYPEHLAPYVLQLLGGIGAAVALILGALAASSEYDWRTLRTLLTLGPGRLTILGAKVVLLAALTLLLAAGILAGAILASLLVAGLQGHAGGWPGAAELLRAALAAWLVLAVWTGFGFALGILLRQTGMAIGIGLVWAIVVEGLILNLLPAATWVKDLRRVFPGANATALAQSFGALPTAKASPTTGLGVGAAQATLVLAGWLLVFLAVSAVAFWRRDVST
jgi:ABC-2 type transport system permease protein